MERKWEIFSPSPSLSWIWRWFPLFAFFWCVSSLQRAHHITPSLLFFYHTLYIFNARRILLVYFWSRICCKFSVCLQFSNTSISFKDERPPAISSFLTSIIQTLGLGNFLLQGKMFEVVWTQDHWLVHFSLFRPFPRPIFKSIGFVSIYRVFAENCVFTKTTATPPSWQHMHNTEQWTFERKTNNFGAPCSLSNNYDISTKNRFI